MVKREVYYSNSGFMSLTGEDIGDLWHTELKDKLPNFDWFIDDIFKEEKSLVKYELIVEDEKWDEDGEFWWSTETDDDPFCFTSEHLVHYFME